MTELTKTSTIASEAQEILVSSEWSPAPLRAARFGDVTD